jgi:TatD DNase family protein
MLPPLIDTHCHLDDKKFSDDRNDVIQRAGQEGIAAMLTLGVDRPTSEMSLALASEHEPVYAAVGLHANDAARYEGDLWPRLEELAAHPKVIAWGEIGLDYHWDFATKEQQHRVFRDQLAIARDARIPIVVHIRKAHDDSLAILSEPEFKNVRGILHCWSGTVDEAKRGIDLGYLIGIGGPITYNKSNLSGIARDLPWESLVVETDAPYLAPVPQRGKRNEPALVRHTFDKLVEAKADRSPDYAAETLWSNFRRVFGRFHVAFPGTGAA